MSSAVDSLAQNKKLDSLLTLIKTDKEDTNKVKHLYKVCNEYRLIGEYDKGISYGKQALTLAAVISNEVEKSFSNPIYKAAQKGAANSYNHVGTIYFNQSNYPEALKNYVAALKIKEEVKDKKGMAACYGNIGLIYYYQGNYPEALRNQFEDLKIAKEIGDKNGISITNNNIGSIYINQGNYPEALKSFLNSLKIYEEIGDKYGIGSSYQGIGNIYMYQRNYPEALKNHFSSLKIKEEMGDKQGIAASYMNIGSIYYSQGNYSEALKNDFAALKIVEELKDKNGIANCYSNIGNAYCSQINYPEALKNLFASLNIYEEIGDKNGIASSFINLGKIYTKENKTKEASTYLNKALTLSKEIGSKDDMKDSYACLTSLDSIKGNYKAAFEHHKLFIIYRDSLNNEETKKKSLQESIQYEFEKRELASKAEQDKLDVKSAEEKKRQKITIYAVVGLLVIVMVFSFFLYRRFKLTQKQKEIIEIKEIETQHQKHLVEEKHHEITDSINYAERIQRSMLASKQLLNENSKSLSKGLTNGEDGYFVFFKPKDVVSGDFYWASKIKTNLFCLVTADSTGHGVPGAIMSMLNMNSLKEAITKGLTEADEILNYTREIIINTLANDGSADGGKDGMDCSLLIFDYKTMNLNWCAANNPVWIVRNAGQSNVELIELKPQKMPVGKHDRQNEPFIKQTIKLQQGDHIYAITDGFPDQFWGEKGKKFMAKNLKELLQNNAHLSMVEQKTSISETFKNWVGDLEQIDDVCIIGIRL